MKRMYLRDLPKKEEELLRAIGRAILKDEAQKVKKLLKPGLRLNARSDEENYLSLQAVHYGAGKCLALLLAAGADPHNYTPYEENPLLSLAIRDKRHKMIPTIVKGGANPEKQDREGMTALQLAVDLKDCKAIWALIEGGARFKKKDQFNENPLHRVAELKDPKLVAHFIKQGFDVNQQGDNGHTPLFEAVSFVRLQNIQLLLAAGANPYLEDQAGETVFDYTADESLKKMMREKALMKEPEPKRKKSAAKKLTKQKRKA